MLPRSARIAVVLAGILLAAVAVVPAQILLSGAVLQLPLQANIAAVAFAADANLADERLIVQNWQPGGTRTYSYNIALSPGERTIVGVAQLTQASMVMQAVVAPQPVEVRQGGQDVMVTPTVSCTGNTRGGSNALQFCTGSIEASNYQLRVTPSGNAGAFAVFLLKDSKTRGASMDDSPYNCPTVERNGVAILLYENQPTLSQGTARLSVRSGSDQAFGRLFNQSGTLLCTASNRTDLPTECNLRPETTRAMFLVVLNTNAQRDETSESMLRVAGTNTTTASCVSW